MENETEKLEIAVKALKKITKPEGAWNNEMETYLTNVIKWCIKTATKALEEIGKQ